MKGVFLVAMMIGLVIVALLVVKNVTSVGTLEGKPEQIQAMDRAKEAADLLNQKALETDRSLEEILQQD